MAGAILVGHAVTIAIRDYRDPDAVAVGSLIAETYAEFNLGFASPGGRADLLGPFRHHRSAEPKHREDIAEAIRAPVVLVGQEAGTIAGVLRGGRVDKKGRTVLQSLFVAGTHQRRGLGSLLVEAFEDQCRLQGVGEIVLASTLHAVPFYLARGYRRSTGSRTMRSFGSTALPYQPMKKAISPP